MLGVRGRGRGCGDCPKNAGRARGAVDAPPSRQVREASIARPAAHSLAGSAAPRTHRVLSDGARPCIAAGGPEPDAGAASGLLQ